MSINSCKTFEAINDGTQLIVEATTWLPAIPKLLTFCCGYRLIDKKTKRGGKEVPHGNLLYLDCEPKIFDPTGPSGPMTFRWAIDNADYLPCKNCHLAIVEFDLPPKLDWTTQVHPCPRPPTPSILLFNAPVSAPALGGPNTPQFLMSWWSRYTGAVADTENGTAWLAGRGTSPEPPDDTAEMWGGTAGPLPTPGLMLYVFSSGLIGGNTLAPISTTVWHHNLLTGDFGNGAFTLLIDGVAQPYTFNTGEGPADVPFSRDFTLNLLGILGSTGAVVELAEFWLEPNMTLDGLLPHPDGPLGWFLTPDGKPGDVGDNGELPMGRPPLVYGHGGAADFLQPNLGYGGSFVVLGAAADGSTPQVGT